MGFVRRRTASGWSEVAAREYGGDFEGVERHELVDTPEYRVRYFRVAPGAATADETHPHDHSVVIDSGRARVTLGDEHHEVAVGDVVYVEGDERHRFETLGDEPLGFFCVTGPRRA